MFSDAAICITKTYAGLFNSYWQTKYELIIGWGDQICVIFLFSQLSSGGNGKIGGNIILLFYNRLIVSLF